MKTPALLIQDKLAYLLLQGLMTKCDISCGFHTHSEYKSIKTLGTNYTIQYTKVFAEMKLHR